MLESTASLLKMPGMPWNVVLLLFSKKITNLEKSGMYILGSARS